MAWRTILLKIEHRYTSIGRRAGQQAPALMRCPCDNIDGCTVKIEVEDFEKGAVVGGGRIAGGSPDEDVAVVGSGG